MDASTAIIRKGSVDEVVAHRDRALELYTRGLQMVVEAMEVHKLAAQSKHAAASTLTDNRIWYRLDSAEGVVAAIEQVRRTLDSDVWRYLLNASGLRNLMDATAMEAFNTQTSKKPPPVTKDTVAATFASHGEQRHAIFRRGAVEVFRRLDRRFASNGPFKVEPKLVIDHALSGLGGWNHYSTAEAKVGDLDRIMHVLDGKDPKDHRGNAAAMVHQASNRRLGEVETDYFRFRLFKNGNLHIAFKRMDLVERLNKLIAEECGVALADGGRRRRAA
jgi:hypothetical protein